MPPGKHLLVERVNKNNRKTINGGWSTGLLTKFHQVLAHRTTVQNQYIQVQSTNKLPTFFMFCKVNERFLNPTFFNLLSANPTKW